MKLGLKTAALPTLDLDTLAGWAAGEGFQALEVACWPQVTGDRRRYAGVTHIDVEKLDAAAVRKSVDGRGLEISSLAYYPNNLDPDPTVRAVSPIDSSSAICSDASCAASRRRACIM